LRHLPLISLPHRRSRCDDQPAAGLLLGAAGNRIAVTEDESDFFEGDGVLEKIAVAAAAEQLSEFWSQHVLAGANGNLFKVAKGIGSTEWHSHDDQDETFLILSGALRVELRDGQVDLQVGDLLVIPRGVEHRPVAEKEASFLLIGPEITSNAAGGKPAWSYTDAQP
jgi:mannose-6-phosphate isomerase-like protein (cupin superfamily)